MKLRPARDRKLQKDGGTFKTRKKSSHLVLRTSAHNREPTRFHWMGRVKPHSDLLPPKLARYNQITVYEHYVPSPIPVVAVTSPVSMLRPLTVSVIPNKP